MKKVAFIFPTLLPMPAVKGGATETLIQQLIDANEEKQQCLFHIYCIYDKEAEEQAPKYRYTKFIYIKQEHSLVNSVRFLFYRLRRKFSRHYVPEPYLTAVTARLEKEDYDVVLVESSVRFVPYLRKKQKAPVGLHLHFDAVGSWKQDLDRIIAACDGILCVSRFIEQTIRDYNPAVPTYVFPNAIDTNLFHHQANEEKSAQLRERLGIAPADKVILYSGRLLPFKGVLELIKAYKQAATRIPDLKLILAGSAEYGQTVRDMYFESLVAEIGTLLDKQIFMTGYIAHEDMPVYYGAADVVVMPTLRVHEAAGLTALEALASGCYFIGSDSGAIPEVAGREYAAIIPQGADFVEKLANQLVVTVQEHKRTAEETPGRARVLRLYNAENYYDNFLVALQEMGWGNQ